MAQINFQNRTLYHRDNLEILRGINTETVHLIATDPPFNKNRDFHATPDSLAAGARFTDRWRWETDIHQDWIDQIQDDWPAVWSIIESTRLARGDDMAAFLCWLGVRLLEMRRVLREDGSIYIHIDHTAHAYVKALMDAVFGHQNFLNEIVWLYKSGGASPKKYFSRKHDSILLYKRGASYTFNPQKEKSYNRELKPYRFAGVKEYKDDIGWYTLVGMKDYWQIDMVGRTSSERTGYPTQKPLALYQRMIQASSNPGDIVLDPFCGCATTPVAAESLGRQWIGIDIWDKAHETVLRRLAAENLAVPDLDDSDAKPPGASRLLTSGDVTYSKKPPTRTDDNEMASPMLTLRIQHPVEPWQKLPNRVIRSILSEAQNPYAADAPDMPLTEQQIALIGCAGCGRVLESPFMELDHIQPKAEGGDNYITNRVLICRPCNGIKRDNLTLRGLIRENKRSGWMHDENLARRMLDKARLQATLVRDNYHSEIIQTLIARHSQR